MSFRVCIEEFRFRYMRDRAGNPVACILPKKPTIKRIKEDFGTQSGVRAFADLVLRYPHPQAIPTKPRRVIFVNAIGDEVKL
jgi:hypothetical protein